MFGSALDVEQGFGHHARMHRTYVRRRVVAASLLGLVLWLAVPAAANALHGDAVVDHAPTAEYVVTAGDTLWDIAVAVAPGRDPRETVDLIGAMNGLHDGAIAPGMRLVVPAAG
jgi:hypothetical protein